MSCLGTMSCPLRGHSCRPAPVLLPLLAQLNHSHTAHLDGFSPALQVTKLLTAPEIPGTPAAAEWYRIDDCTGLCSHYVHRNTSWLGWKGPYSPPAPPLLRAGCSPSSGCPGPSRGLGHLHGWSTHSPAQHCQGLTTLSKEFPLHI